MKTFYRCLVLTVLVALCGMLGCGPEKAPEGTATKPDAAVMPMGEKGMPTPPTAAPGMAAPGTAAPGSTPPATP